MPARPGRDVGGKDRPMEDRVLVVATNNAHKVAEIRTISEELGFKVMSKKEAGVDGMEVEETGNTFEANAELKARAVAKATGRAAIADDSGLMVEALNGDPGVYSSRYAGEDGNDPLNNEKLLREMKDVPEGQRKAKFVSALCLVYEDGSCVFAKGECPGKILTAPRGNGGFGYDPLFVPDGFDQSFGELPQETKNQISHRSHALKALAEILKER